MRREDTLRGAAWASVIIEMGSEFSLSSSLAPSAIGGRAQPSL